MLLERMGTMSLLNIESTLQINSCFDINIQNKPACSKCNSVIGFFNLRASNLGRHDRYDY